MLERGTGRTYKLRVLPNEFGKTNQKIIYTAEVHPQFWASGAPDGTGLKRFNGSTHKYCFVKSTLTYILQPFKISVIPAQHQDSNLSSELLPIHVNLS